MPDLAQIKKDTLILVYDKNSYLFKQISDRKYKIENTFRKLNPLLRTVRLILRKAAPNSSFKIWLGDWYKNDTLKNVNCVLIFGYDPTFPLIQWMGRTYPQLRIIVWHWNPIKKFHDFNRQNIEQWTFDKGDSIKYQISYNNQYYFNNIKLKNNKIKYDIIFVGADKGRLPQLQKIEKLLNRQGLKTKFYIVSDNPIFNRRGTNRYIEYSKVLDLISESRAILDVLQMGQAGMTLRPLEALFFEKKLITTSPDIANADFYKRNNIFILGKDSIRDMKVFIDSPYEKVDDLVKDHYDFDGWIHGFWRESDFV